MEGEARWLPGGFWGLEAPAELMRVVKFLTSMVAQAFGRPESPIADDTITRERSKRCPACHRPRSRRRTRVPPCVVVKPSIL